MSNSYYVEAKDEGSPIMARPKRKTFKQWLRSYINGEDNFSQAEPTISVEQTTAKFTRSFEGWNIRLHRAVDGHIVEAWKNDYDRPMQTGNYRAPHELFIIKDDEDMGKILNDILVQLMLRN